VIGISHFHNIFLSLAATAPPRSSLCEHGSNDARAAARARPPVIAVDREVVLETTLQSVGIDVVVDTRPAHFDGAFENVDDGPT
jgi:hypothetical protein